MTRQSWAQVKARWELRVDVRNAIADAFPALQLPYSVAKVAMDAVLKHLADHPDVHFADLILKEKPSDRASGVPNEDR